MSAAIAAITFAIRADEGIAFLNCWLHGEFDAIRREWPEAPTAVFIGADPLLKGSVAKEVSAVQVTVGDRSIRTEYRSEGASATPADIIQARRDGYYAAADVYNSTGDFFAEEAQIDRSIEIYLDNNKSMDDAPQQIRTLHIPDGQVDAYNAQRTRVRCLLPAMTDEQFAGAVIIGGLITNLSPLSVIECWIAKTVDKAPIDGETPGANPRGLLS